jgi:hypothetical protein
LGEFFDDGSVDLDECKLGGWTRHYSLAISADKESAKGSGPSRVRVSALLQGFVSGAALADVHARLDGWLPTIGDVVRESAVANERLEYEGDKANELGRFLADLLEESNVGVEHLWSAEGLAILGGCLDAIRIPQDLQNSLQKRLVNAITLYRDANRQTLPAIQLMLYFSAIEAAVTEYWEGTARKRGVVDQIKSYTPALLTHDLARRMQASIAIKELYKYRNRMAHGHSVAAPELYVRRAKKLAAGVVRGMCSWLGQFDQESDRPEHGDFVSQLQQSAATETPMPGGLELGELLPII